MHICIRIHRLYYVIYVHMLNMLFQDVIPRSHAMSRYSWCARMAWFRALVTWFWCFWVIKSAPENTIFHGFRGWYPEIHEIQEMLNTRICIHICICIRIHRLEYVEYVNMQILHFPVWYPQILSWVGTHDVPGYPVLGPKIWRPRGTPLDMSF